MQIFLNSTQAGRPSSFAFLSSFHGYIQGKALHWAAEDSHTHVWTRSLKKATGSQKVVTALFQLNCFQSKVRNNLHPPLL